MIHDESCLLIVALIEISTNLWERSLETSQSARTPSHRTSNSNPEDDELILFSFANRLVRRRASVARIEDNYTKRVETSFKMT